MKERNRNKDWDQHRNRFNQKNEYNQQQDESGYGVYNQNTGGYSGHVYRGKEEESQGIYNSGGYNSAGQYNTGNQQDYNRVNYFPDNDENRNYNDRDYENNQYGTSGTYGYKGNRGEYQGNYNQGGYGENAGYENDYSKPYVNRGRGDVGHKSHFEKRYYDQRGNSNQPYNRYGGDTRNYGNANQGGFDRDWWERTKDEVASWFGDDDAERRRKMDRRDMGGYKGKGPKNYRRSEQRILEDVCDRLTYDDMLDATDIEVQVMGSEVILSGNVVTREQKRRAEDLVESVYGVENVENRLKVGHGESQSTTDTGNALT